MKLSALALAVLAFAEEFRGIAYQDDGRVWTIGYGHTGPDVHGGMICTVAQAETWLAEDVRHAEMVVEREVLEPITQAQFDALVLFVYNVGEYHFAGDDAHGHGPSTLLRLLNQPNKPPTALHDIADQFLEWTKVKGVENIGLERRRRVERALFLS